MSGKNQNSKLINKLLAFAGRKGMEVDSQIPPGYLMRECCGYGVMLVRGLIRSVFLRNSSFPLFVGRRVRIRCGNKIMFAPGVKIKEGTYIDGLSTGGVRIGRGSQLGRDNRIECTGSLSHVGKGVAIGERTSFGSDCYFGAAGGITIGSDVIAGQYVRFHSENHNYHDRNQLIKDQGTTHRGIHVGNNCWIGAGAVFLDGAWVGDGCVVAANAVVTKAFRDNQIIAGIPARVIAER